MNVNDTSSRNPNWIEPVIQARDAFAKLVAHCSQVLRAWNDLKGESTYISRYPQEPEGIYSELPDEITSYPQLTRYQEERRAKTPQTVRLWLSYYNRLDNLTFAVRQWRAEVDTVRALLPSVAPWLDDQRVPPLQRWTSEVQGELAQLGGQIHRLMTGDTPAELDVDTFEQLTAKVYHRLSQLKRIPNIPTSHRLGTAESPEGPADSSTASTPPHKPKGWRQKELIQQTISCNCRISDSTFRAIRKDAGIIASEPGGKGQKRKYSVPELKRMISTLDSTLCMRRDSERIAAAWLQLLSPVEEE